MCDDTRSFTPRTTPKTSDPVLQDFDDAMQTPDIPVAVAAITALTGVLKRSQARTAMQLQTELRMNVETVSQATHYICCAIFCSLTLVQLLNAKQDGVQEYVQLGAACELFLRYVTRTSNDEHGKTLDQMEFKRSLIRRGDGFKDQSIRSRDAIAKYGSAFVRDGAVLLLHGYSSVVMRLLEKVALPTAALICNHLLTQFAGQRFSQAI
jgi:translation initiation factor eIF-2B subunit alpha